MRYTSPVRLVVIALVACSARELPPERVPAPVVPDAGAIDALVVKAPEPGGRLAGGAVPLAYDVRLELDPDNEAFAGRVEIRVRFAAPADQVWLHADGLEIAKATIGGAAVTKLAGPPGVIGFAGTFSGELTLALDYTGHLDDEAEGLFRQKTGKQWFLYAQSQAVFARKIVPCFDEPQWKPAWRVTLVVPKQQVALANGAQIKETTLADGRREIRFAEIGAMPSYLFSVAVGPFAVRELGTVGRDRIAVRAAVAPADADRLDIVREKLPLIVDALEHYLDRPLPVAKLDLVAVPEFFGAMENVGLVTFDRSILVGDRKSVTATRRFMRFAAHELAHQWFGNLVTPAWWDELWLSEGLTTWLADKVSDELGGAEDPELRAELARLAALAADDEEPRSIRRAIAPGDDIDDRFDEIAYEKGGAVLEMVERLVHPEAMRGALRRYLAMHRDRSATSRDFLAALEGASPDAAAVLRSYLEFAGVPIVDIVVDCAPSPKRLELRVRDQAATVPICIRHDRGELCKTTRAGERIALDHCPAWVIGNAGGVGYYRVGTPAVAKGAPLVTTERLAHADDIAAALLRGELAIADAVRELRVLAAGDTPSQYAALQIAEAIDPLVDDAARPAWTRWLAARFAARMPKLLAARSPLEYELRDRLPLLVGGSFDAKTIRAARAIVDRAIKAGIRAPESALAIAAPRGGKVLFDRIVAAAVAAPSEQRSGILDGLGWFGPEFAPRVVELVVDPRFKPVQVWPALERMLGRPATRTAAWRALRERAAEITNAVARVELDVIVAGTRALCERSVTTELEAAFPSATATARKKAVAAIDRCISRRTKAGNFSGAFVP